MARRPADTAGSCRHGPRFRRDGPDAHRDLRAAIVSAARQRLRAGASWTILQTAVGGSREERRAVLNTHPYAIADRHRRRYGTLVVDACQATDREVRRAAFGQLREWSPWLTGTTDLVVDRLTDLGETVANIEVANLLEAGGDTVLGAALARLLDRDRTALIEPARSLAHQPSYAATATRLLIDLGRLDNLDEIAGLCANRPVLAVRCAEHIGARLRSLRDQPEPAVLTGTITRLAARGDLAGGLFAVALVRHGAGFGWKSPWRDLLIELRRHYDAADVREEACTINMA